MITSQNVEISAHKHGAIRLRQKYETSVEVRQIVYVLDWVTYVRTYLVHERTRNSRYLHNGWHANNYYQLYANESPRLKSSSAAPRFSPVSFTNYEPNLHECRQSCQLRCRLPGNRKTRCITRFPHYIVNYLHRPSNDFARTVGGRVRKNRQTHTHKRKNKNPTYSRLNPIFMRSPAFVVVTWTTP